LRKSKKQNNLFLGCSEINKRFLTLTKFKKLRKPSLSEGASISAEMQRKGL
jgi:hypothetical protein